MLAAQQFNQREVNQPEGQAIVSDRALPIEIIYGAVTTGEIWKFLKLLDTKVSIDLTDYYISPHLNKILSILIHGLGLPVPAL